jgi:sterol desaturase/sphingolipid hydroxylase (fatty acid hydroxylase superfamily)
LRSHPLEHFAYGATRVLGMAAGIGAAVYVTGGNFLPETASVIFWYEITYVLIGFRSVDHLHIPVSYGRFLDVLIGSPIMHQVQHSAKDKYRDVNMAGAGYLFDWLFGTLYIPEKQEIRRWGLNGDELGDSNPHNSLMAFFIEPLHRMRHEIRKALAKK